MNTIGSVRFPAPQQLPTQEPVGRHLLSDLWRQRLRKTHGVRRRVVVRAFASVMLLLLPLGLAGTVAHAQPDDAASETGITLPWSTYGLPSTVELYGEGESSYTVALPAGLTATRLRGMIHTPTDIAAGYVEIDDGEGNFLASVDLPPMLPGVVMAPFDVDISAASVRSSSVELSFRVRARDDRDDSDCEAPPRVELSNLATVFTGTLLPVTTVANFFPPVLSTVTIYTPTDASSAEQQAVLKLAAALARFYSARPLSIAVASQARGAIPPPAAGLDRAVVVENGEPGLSVENAGAPNAYLRISGDGGDLSKQVSLIATQLQPFAQVSSARVDEAALDPAVDGDTLTFEQLKVGAKRTDVLGSSNLQVGIQRTSLGPRFDRAQVHLLADYTPVPAGDAASVVVRSEDLVVYRAALDNSGHLDATFELANSDLNQQWIDLEFALTYTSDQPCGSLVAPLTFQIDPRSSLTMHRGGPPLGGFAAFPAEFSPRFLVALDGSGPNQLSYATQVVAAIARFNKSEITPEVVDLQTAAEASTGALIVANSEAVQQTSLNPPVSGNGSIVNFAVPAELQVNINDGLGSIQAFADPQRNRSVILVTTAGDWALVDPLFSYIDGSTSDWSQLTGDVLAAGAGGTPVNVAIRTADSAFEPTVSNASSSALNASAARVAWIASGVLAAIVVFTVIMLRLRRRNRGAREPVGVHSANTPG